LTNLTSIPTVKFEDAGKVGCQFYFPAAVPNCPVHFDALLVWERFSLYNAVLISKRAPCCSHTPSVGVFSFPAWKRLAARGESGQTYTWRDLPNAWGQPTLFCLYVWERRKPTSLLYVNIWKKITNL